MAHREHPDGRVRAARRSPRRASPLVPFALTFTLLMAVGDVRAVELRLPEGRVSLAGSLATWDVFRLHSDTPRERPSSLLDLRLDATRGDRFRLFTALRAGFDGKIGDPHRGNPVIDLDEIYQSKDIFLNVDEAYLDLYFDSFELRIGKQKISWGQLDDLQPTDQVNPEDLTEFYFRPELERKIGVPGIRLAAYQGPWTLDLVWNPFFTAYRFPARDDRWFPPILMVPDTLETPLGTLPVRTRYPDVNEPPHTLASSDVAARIRRFYEGVEMSLIAFHGWDKSATFDTFGTATVVPTGDPEAPAAPTADLTIAPSLHRITVIGADLAMPLWVLALRAEAAWIHGRAFPLRGREQLANDPQLVAVVEETAQRVAMTGIEETVPLPIGPAELERESLQYGVGIDWFVNERVSRRLTGGESLAGTFVLLQLIETVIFDHDAPFIARQVEHLLAATLRQTFRDERLSLELKAAYNPNHGDFFLWPQLGYKVTPNLIGLLEARVIGGTRTQLIGQYRDYDGVRVGMRYLF